MIKWALPISLLAYCAASCPQVDPSLAVLLPHENDCRKFYLCSNGRAILMTCAQGTEFNLALLVCDWPQNAGCQEKTSQAPTVPLKSTEMPNTLTTRDPTGSPSENTTSGSIGNTKAPTETTISTSGLTETSMSSKKSTASPNSTLGTTDSPILTTEAIAIDLTNSNNGQTSSSFLPTGSTGSTDSTPGASTEPTTTESLKDAPGCPPTDPQRFLLPNPYNCSRFFSCSNGVLFPKECPDDLYFNPELMVCDWPKNSGCDDSGKNNQDTNNPPGASTTSSDLSTIELTSPSTGTNTSTQWDNSTSEPIVEADISTTVTENDLTTELETGQNMPECPKTDPPKIHLLDAKNCSKFYSCSNGIAIPMECPEGLHFFPETMVCDWPENASYNCSSNTHHETTTEQEEESTIHINEPTTEFDDSSDGSTTEASNSTNKPTTETEFSTETVYGCPPNNPESYLLPKLSNCSQFYSCSNGVAVTKECPDGLYFNPNILVCDWRENVGCISAVTTEIQQISTINYINAESNESTKEPQEITIEVNETTKELNKTSTELDESRTKPNCFMTTENR